MERYLVNARFLCVSAKFQHSGSQVASLAPRIGGLVGIFGGSKKDRERRLGVTTASLLVEAARSGDRDRVAELIFGPETTDEGLSKALVLFIHLAHEHLDVIQVVIDSAGDMPASAEMAFRTGIQCAKIGNATNFHGGNATGQALFIAVIARAVALSDSAMQDLARLRQM